MRRVMVIGCAGAGKTAFASRLAKQLELPIICLDLHFGRPGWGGNHLHTTRLVCDSDIEGFLTANRVS